MPAAGSEYVVPVILGDDGRAVAAAGRLQEQGFDVRAIRPPSVPAGHRPITHLDPCRPRIGDADPTCGGGGGSGAAMTGFIVAGTDTDAGKTTFCLLWLTAFGDQFDYWKPVETGPSDTESVRRLVPGAIVHPPLARFAEAVAPELAAAHEGRAMPGIAEIDRRRPEVAASAAYRDVRRAAIADDRWDSPSRIDRHSGSAGRSCRVVSRSAPIARSLQALAGMREHGLVPTALALIGPPDEYAAKQILRHGGVRTFSLSCPESWDVVGIRQAVDRNRAELSRLLGERGASAPWFLDGEKASRPTPPTRRDLIRRDRAAVWHPYTSLGDPDDPLPVIGATAEFLELADGRRLIDGISSWWTILHGHRHPPLMAALRDATRKFDHVLFAGVTHPPAVELAELLLQSAPWPDGRVFFSDNGSTAVEVALKMAYQTWCHRGEPQRTLFVGFENGYHGDTFGAMAIRRDPTFFGRFEPLLFRALQVSVSAERLADVLRRHRGEVAAVILEPLVQGAGGMRMHAAGRTSSRGGGRPRTWRFLHRRRGDDRRWPDRFTMGLRASRHRAGLNLCCQDLDRRHDAAGCHAGIAGDRHGVRHAGSVQDVFSWAFVHRPSAGVCGCRGELARFARRGMAQARDADRATLAKGIAFADGPTRHQGSAHCAVPSPRWISTCPAVISPTLAKKCGPPASSTAYSCDRWETCSMLCRPIARPMIRSLKSQRRYKSARRRWSCSNFVAYNGVKVAQQLSDPIEVKPWLTVTNLFMLSRPRGHRPGRLPGRFSCYWSRSPYSLISSAVGDIRAL